jgi:mRNA interferase MazF
MKRGDLYRVYKATRVFVVVSRQVLIESRYSTMICAPVYTCYDGLSTQVQLGIDDGLKHVSSIHCDELVSIPKRALTDYVGTLSNNKVGELQRALSIALEFDIP